MTDAPTPPQIDATTPVTVPGTAQVVYDKWYLTQLIGKFSPETAPLIVHLRRASITNAGTTLMPNSKDSEISFTVDAWKEMTDTPEIAAAMGAILNAVVAYATKKKLL